MNCATAIDRVKQTVRVLEATVTPRRQLLRVDDRRLRLVRSMWWNETSPAWFADEIEPYWNAIRPSDMRVILDVGAANGLFTLSACIRAPAAHVVAFEPSCRQRVLLRRNVRINGYRDRVQVESLAAWNSEADMVFRSNAAMSALQAAGEHLAGLPFAETVHAEPLDAWGERAGVTRIDLIKMDIEGAEIEALEGATKLMSRYRPTLLVQAYHLRGGLRTYERCAAIVRALGYRCREAVPGKGLLYAECNR